jgi:hypothetical protein
MSGVFSIASHWALQYLPDVVRHEQTGCAHFTVFSGVISFLLAFESRVILQTSIIVSSEEHFCAERDTLRY